MPASNNGRVRRLTRLFNKFGGTTQQSAIYFNTTNIGHGIVTECTY